MRLQNNFPFIYTILFILISGLAHFAFSCQQSDNAAVATQSEELAMKDISAHNSMDFDILKGLLTDIDAEVLPESAVLEACYEQLGVFILPASEAEPYLPEGFEPLQPEGFEPENADLSGEYAPVNVWSIECKPVQEKEEPLNMVWVEIVVVPPEAYRSDDVASYSVPVQLFTSSPTLVETLHSFGVAQAELSDVTHELNEKADTVRTGMAHATGGGENITMESQIAGEQTPVEGFESRKFGVENGRVTGVVDLIISDFDRMQGEASLARNTLFSEQNPESVIAVHAWEIEFHLEPVEYR